MLYMYMLFSVSCNYSLKKSQIEMKCVKNVSFQKISIPPTTEGIGNSEGEGGGVKTQEIPEGRGIV